MLGLLAKQTAFDSYQSSADFTANLQERGPGFFEGTVDAVTKGAQHAWAAQKIADYGATNENIAELNATRINPVDTGTFGSIANSLVNITAAGALGVPKYAVAGAGAGAIAGAAPSLGIGAVPGAIGGFGIGAKFGFITNAGKLQGISQYYDLKKHGVDDDTAMKGAVLSGLLTSIGVAAPPFVGQSVKAQMVSGAAINVGLGGIERKGLSLTLGDAGYKEIAEQYKFFDANAMAAEVLLGALLPVGNKAFNKAFIPKDLDTEVDIKAYTAAIDTLHRHEAMKHSPELPVDLQSDRAFDANVNAVAKAFEEGRAIDPSELQPVKTMKNPEFDAQQAMARKAWDEVILETTGKSLVDIENAGKFAQDIEAEVATRLRQQASEQIVDMAVAKPETGKAEFDFMEAEAARLVKTMEDVEVQLAGATGEYTVRAADLMEQLKQDRIKTEQDTNLHQILVACEVTHG